MTEQAETPVLPCLRIIGLGARSLSSLADTPYYAEAS